MKNSLVKSENSRKTLTDFQSFENGMVDCFEENNNLWFRLSDIGKVLEMDSSSVRKMKQNGWFDEDEISNVKNIHGGKDILYVSESALYRILNRSNSPKAKPFERWVTKKVIPSIRKNGAYQVMPQKTEREMNIEEAHILENLIPLCPVETYRQILASHITKKVTGEFLLPLPKLKNQIMTASQIADELHISKKRVGEIANKNNLKTEENGEWIWDRAANGKQVKNFVYNSKGFEAIKEFVNA